MPTTRYDLAYGRQGGRVVPWRTDDRFHPGQVVLVRKHLGTAQVAVDQHVIITRLLPGGRADIAYGDVTSLILSTADLYPLDAHARGTDPDTSHAAAFNLTPERLTEGQQAALKHLALAGDTGCTDFELADRTGWAQTSIGKRRHELAATGLVVATNQKRRNHREQLCKVWKITPTGLAAWRATNGAA